MHNTLSTCIWHWVSIQEMGNDMTMTIYDFIVKFSRRMVSGAVICKSSLWINQVPLLGFLTSQASQRVPKVVINTFYLAISLEMICIIILKSSTQFWHEGPPKKIAKKSSILIRCEWYRDAMLTDFSKEQLYHIRCIRRISVILENLSMTTKMESTLLIVLASPTIKSIAMSTAY